MLRYVGVCVCHKYAHTVARTHCIWGTQIWAAGSGQRGRDKTLGEPKEFRTKSRHICIRICEQSTHVYVYMLGGWMRSWANCFVLLTHLVFRKRKSSPVSGLPPWPSDLGPGLLWRGSLSIGCWSFLKDWSSWSPGIVFPLAAKLITPKGAEWLGSGSSNEVKFAFNHEMDPLCHPPDAPRRQIGLIRKNWKWSDFWGNLYGLWLVARGAPRLWGYSPSACRAPCYSSDDTNYRFFKPIELTVQLLDCFLRSNKSNVNQNGPVRTFLYVQGASSARDGDCGKFELSRLNPFFSE